MPSLTRIAVADRVIHERRSNGHDIRAPSSASASVGVEIISSAYEHTIGGGEGMRAEGSTLTASVAVTSPPTNATPETKTPSPSSPPVPVLQSSSEGVSTAEKIKDHRNKTRSIRHEGRSYNTTYIPKGGVSKYRCSQYLPRGTAGAKWGSFRTAKQINPDANPLRCPGVLVVDEVKNEKIISIAHECVLAYSAVSSSTDSTPKQKKGTRRRDPQSGKSRNQKNGRIMWHEGRPHICTSSNSDRIKYRCFRYRPGGGNSATYAGEPSGTEQTVWTFYASAKAGNPDAPPYRCPGALIENRKTSEMIINVPHECTPVQTTTKSKKSASNKDDGRADAFEYDEPEFESDMVYDGKKGSKRKDARSGKTMWHEGRPHICTSSNSDRIKYRCFRYRPGGGNSATSAGKSSGSEQANRWTFHASAKASNPDVAPYRCPGTLIENRKTNEMTITVPHECTVHTTTKSKKSASNKDDGRACEYDEPEFESDMFHDGSIAHRKKDALDADASHGDQNVMAGNMESDEGIDAVVDLSIDDDDNNSESSDKAYYKDMCAALTAALNKRKITEKEARIENRRLRKELKRLRR